MLLLYFIIKDNINNIIETISNIRLFLCLVISISLSLKYNATLYKLCNIEIINIILKNIIVLLLSKNSIKDSYFSSY